MSMDRCVVCPFRAMHCLSVRQQVSLVDSLDGRISAAAGRPGR